MPTTTLGEADVNAVAGDHSTPSPIEGQVEEHRPALYFSSVAVEQLLAWLVEREHDDPRWHVVAPCVTFGEGSVEFLHRVQMVDEALPNIECFEDVLAMVVW